MDSLLPNNLAEAARKVIAAHTELGSTIVTAESCTGGLVSAALTEIAGSSAAFLCSYVTYSNEAKEAMLGVPHELLVAHGAVSEAVAGAMADGALEQSGANVAVSISGIAGPDGGIKEKSVGTVMFGLAQTNQDTKTFHKEFGAEKSRAEIRQDAALFALQLLLP